jgi:hypothetical protein
MEHLMEHFSILIGQFKHVVEGCCIHKALHLQGPDGMQPWPEWVVTLNLPWLPHAAAQSPKAPRLLQIGNCMISKGKRSQGCMRVACYRALGDKAMVRVGQFKNPAAVLF